MTPDDYDTPERLDAAAEKMINNVAACLGLNPMQPLVTQTPFIEDLADDAAKLVDVEDEEFEQHFPGDALPQTYYVPTPSQSEITIDATDHIQNSLDDQEAGSAAHSTDKSKVRVNVSDPQVFVVDAMGNRIEGGRVMVTYTTIETDTP